jgi:hypothetical protein
VSQKSWRIAGVLTLAYVVLTFVGFSLQGTTPLLGDGQASAKSTYAA